MMPRCQGLGLRLRLLALAPAPGPHPPSDAPRASACAVMELARADEVSL